MNDKEFVAHQLLNKILRELGLLFFDQGGHVLHDLEGYSCGLTLDEEELIKAMLNGS